LDVAELIAGHAARFQKRHAKVANWDTTAGFGIWARQSAKWRSAASKRRIAPALIARITRVVWYLMNFIVKTASSIESISWRSSLSAQVAMTGFLKSRMNGKTPMGNISKRAKKIGNNTLIRTGIRTGMSVWTFTHPTKLLLNAVADSFPYHGHPNEVVLRLFRFRDWLSSYVSDTINFCGGLSAQARLGISSVGGG
jgi:hypothetical protein